MRQAVPLPKKMRALATDRRGYPIPFIVARDQGGAPLFTANNTERTIRCLEENRCPICGSRLPAGILWFAGGPLSAFHEHGVYADTAMHYECMEYALQVCPWLSAPRYSEARIEDRPAALSRLPGGIYVDCTQDSARPPLFVAVAARDQEVRWDRLVPRVIPARPYVAVEYWQCGRRLTENEARPLIDQALVAATAP